MCMTIDLPHMLATMMVIFVVAFAIEHSGLLHDASRGKRALLIGGAVGVAVFTLNLVWPAGGI